MDVVLELPRHMACFFYTACLGPVVVVVVAEVTLFPTDDGTIYLVVDGLVVCLPYVMLHTTPTQASKYHDRERLRQVSVARYGSRLSSINHQNDHGILCTPPVLSPSYPRAVRTDCCIALLYRIAVSHCPTQVHHSSVPEPQPANACRG